MRIAQSLFGSENFRAIGTLELSHLSSLFLSVNCYMSTACSVLMDFTFLAVLELVRGCIVWGYQTRILYKH